MTDIIISFDTEDFTSSRAGDAIRDEAEILRTLGIKGCFCVVGLVAKQLKNLFSLANSVQCTSNKARLSITCEPCVVSNYCL